MQGESHERKDRGGSKAWIAVLIVLVLLWVGSYLALRNRERVLGTGPGWSLFIPANGGDADFFIVLPDFLTNDSHYASWANRIYWPLLRCEEPLMGKKISFAETDRKWHFLP